MFDEVLGGGLGALEVVGDDGGDRGVEDGAVDGDDRDHQAIDKIAQRLAAGVCRGDEEAVDAVADENV